MRNVISNKNKIIVTLATQGLPSSFLGKEQPRISFVESQNRYKHVFRVSNLFLSSVTDPNTRVLKGILWNSRELTEIQCRIQENAKYLDGIRDLTATRQAGFAKVLARDAALGKKTVFGIEVT